MELKGKLVEMLEQEAGTSKSGKSWTSQTCIIDTGNEFNNIVAVKCMGEDKIKEMNKLNVGEYVSISCNVYSREYNGRYYNNIDGWRFAKNNEKSGEDFVTSDESMPF
tara:strand:+ start:171 stop:494 length:324 start_codon:yes stop_codon:yes gene_type:complete